MSYIVGVRIQPGFFNQKKRRVDEYRVGASPVRLKKTATAPKPKAPRAKYAMPIIPIIAAVGSFAAGAGIASAAVAAGLGTAAAVGSLVVGGLMMVGAALTIVGTVTGNAKLTKIGGIVSLVGGVGALGLGMAGMLTTGASEAASAGVGAAAADATSNTLISSDAVAGSIADQVGGGAAGYGADVVASALPTPAAVSGVALDAAAPMVTGGMVSAPAAQVAADAGAGAVSDAAAGAAQMPVATDIAPPQAGAPSAPAPMQGSGTASGVNTGAGGNTASGVNTGTDGLTNADAAAGVNGGTVTGSNVGPGATSSNGNLFSQYEKWAAANPNLNKTAGYIANSVGGMISGRNPTQMQEAQINLYAEQAKLTEAQRQQLLTRMKNMSGVSSWKK